MSYLTELIAHRDDLLTQLRAEDLAQMDYSVDGRSFAHDRHLAELRAGIKQATEDIFLARGAIELSTHIYG